MSGLTQLRLSQELATHPVHWPHVCPWEAMQLRTSLALEFCENHKLLPNLSFLIWKTELLMNIKEISRHLISFYSLRGEALKGRHPKLGGSEYTWLQATSIRSCLTILGGTPWRGSRGDHVEKVCVWPQRPRLPWPSPHAVALVPRDPGGEKYLYLWPTFCFLSGLNLVVASETKSRVLGWISGLRTDVATSHYWICCDCEANPESVGNMWADPSKESLLPHHYS